MRDTAPWRDGAAGMAEVGLFFGAVRRLARERGHAVAAVDAVAPGQAGAPVQLTYAELCMAAEELAASLADHGVSPLGEGRETAPLGTWMRRGTGWYCVFCAAARLRVPLLALSCDLPDAVVERKRNGEILAAHALSALVVDAGGRAVNAVGDGSLLAHPALGGRNVIVFERLWMEARGSGRVLPDPLSLSAGVESATLCLCYTGGTTRASRCAKVTHGMALHEIATYSRVVQLNPSDKVLQQHSVYWAASCYGEIDVALAFGCTLIFCETWDVASLAATVSAHGASCAGLVPSVLAALEPSDVPSLRVVFTWGEALQARVARAWAKRVHLVDLLISTECWLSLYADWTNHSGSEESRPSFKTVPGTLVRLRQTALDDFQLGCGSRARRSRGVGELLVAGPMVSAGYLKASLNEDAFCVDAAGVRWYCTKDCMEVQEDGGLVFAGRADDLVKVGGIWVDIRDIEQRLEAADSVAEACVCRSSAFVVLRELREDGSTISTLRSVLPADFALFLVPTLLRRAGTGKVDRQRLCDLVGVGALEDEERAERETCIRQLASVVLWYSPLCALIAAAFLHAAWHSWPSQLDREVELLPFSIVTDASSMALTTDAAAWLGSFFVLFLVELVWRSLCLVYAVLLAWYLPQGYVSAVRNFPCGIFGVFLVACILLPSYTWGVAFACPGICLAAYRRRLLSWPLVCFIGLPVWMRDVSYWLTQLRGGFAGIVSWYYWKVRMMVGVRIVTFVIRLQEMVRAIQFRLGLARRCDWCKQRVNIWKGRSDPSIDKQWYCVGCWRHYRTHKQCADCAVWGVNGAINIVTGLWQCQTCQGNPRWSRNRAEAKPPSSLVQPLRFQHRDIALLDTRPCGRGLKRVHSHEDEGHALRCRTESPRRAQLNIVENDADNGAQLSGKVDSMQVETGSPQRARANGADEGAGPPINLPGKSREWLVIERSCGTVFHSLSDSLASLDSLRRTKMTSALRREAGKRLPREAIQRSATLGDLLSELARLQEPPLAPLDTGSCLARDAWRDYAAWGMMWTSRCQWMLRRDQPLQVVVLQQAVDLLVERHVALRAELRDPYTLFLATQRSLSVLEIWRGCLAEPGPPGLWRSAARGAARLFVRAASWSFRAAWPRVGARSAGARASARVQVKVLERSESIDDAEKAIWRKAHEFVPPFQVILAPVGEGDKENVLVHITVTHMLSDGYSIVPIIDDLAQLVTLAEEAAARAPGAHVGGESLANFLPPIPSMLAALEPRIFRTIQGCAGGSGAEFSRDGITLDTIGKKSWRESFMVYATMRRDVVGAVRRSARVLAVPDDVAMLTVIGVTLAWFENQPSKAIGMIVPQRDGPSESDMIGLFADVRHLAVNTGGLSFAGVALRLHHVVQHRLWQAPSPITQFDTTMVNFEWTDFSQKGGFTQHARPRGGTESSPRPLCICVDQPDQETWRLRVGFDPMRYDEERREQFFRLFEKALHALLTNPLDLVWPAESGDAS